MLKQIADLTYDKEEILNDLKLKKRVLDIFGQIHNFYDNKSLFLASFFKLFSDPDGSGENLNKCYSLNDFKEMQPSELETKVFVHSTAASNLKLDDNLILKTIF